MTLTPRAMVRMLAILTLLAAPAAASAQEGYTFTLGALGGVGGSTDADPGDDLGNLGLQLNLSIVTEPRTQLGLRLGRLDLDQNEGFGELADAELTYFTIAGEYRYNHAFYESGIYLGLGGYQLEGTSLLDLSGQDETGVGVVLGLTGEFQLTNRLGVLVELSGHWADLDQASVYAMGHVGLAVHF